jgi:hypothetical protein
MGGSVDEPRNAPTLPPVPRLALAATALAGPLALAGMLAGGRAGVVALGAAATALPVALLALAERRAPRTGRLVRVGLLVLLAGTLALLLALPPADSGAAVGPAAGARLLVFLGGLGVAPLVLLSLGLAAGTRR